MASDLDLSRVNTCSDSDPDRPKRIANGLCASNGAPGPIEGGEEPVPCLVYLTSTTTGQLSANDDVVLVEKIAPAAIPQVRGPGCGS